MVEDMSDNRLGPTLRYGFKKFQKIFGVFFHGVVSRKER